MARERDTLRKIVERHLGSLEAQIMAVVWERPDLSVRDVVEVLPRGRSRAYTTVMTVMSRLAAVPRVRAGHPGSPKQHVC